jgi:hypothetical protein
MSLSSGIMAKNGFTREKLVEFTATLKDKHGEPLKPEAVEASVTVVLSPTLSSERGDCRGNFSAQGHLYYVERIDKPARDEKGKPVMKKDGTPLMDTRYIVKFRETALDKFRRPTVKVAGESDPATADAETPATADTETPANA